MCQALGSMPCTTHKTAKHVSITYKVMLTVNCLNSLFQTNKKERNQASITACSLSEFFSGKKIVCVCTEHYKHYSLFVCLFYLLTFKRDWYKLVFLRNRIKFFRNLSSVLKENIIYIWEEIKFVMEIKRTNTEKLLINVISFWNEIWTISKP